jgi:hypothetical protein
MIHPLISLWLNLLLLLLLQGYDRLKQFSDKRLMVSGPAAALTNACMTSSKCNAQSS